MPAYLKPVTASEAASVANEADGAAPAEMPHTAPPPRPTGYGTAAYPHGPTGIVIVPRHVAGPLLHNGGYSQATAAELQAEISILEARLAALPEHL